MLTPDDQLWDIAVGTAGTRNGSDKNGNWR